MNFEREKKKRKKRDQQERLKLIHDKFKEEVNQHLLDCRSILEELEAYNMELKGTTDYQKVSYMKLLRQVEEALMAQIDDAETRITAVHKLSGSGSDPCLILPPGELPTRFEEKVDLESQGSLKIREDRMKFQHIGPKLIMRHPEIEQSAFYPYSNVEVQDDLLLMEGDRILSQQYGWILGVDQLDHPFFLSVQDSTRHVLPGLPLLQDRLVGGAFYGWPTGDIEQLSMILVEMLPSVPHAILHHLRIWAKLPGHKWEFVVSPYPDTEVYSMVFFRNSVYWTDGTGRVFGLSFFEVNCC